MQSSGRVELYGTAATSPCKNISLRGLGTNRLAATSGQLATRTRTYPRRQLCKSCTFEGNGGDGPYRERSASRSTLQCPANAG